MKEALTEQGMERRERRPQQYQGHNRPIPPNMNLRDFLQRTRVYEEMPVEFSPRFRRATWTGMTMTLLGSLLILLLPFIETHIQSIYAAWLPWLQQPDSYLRSYLIFLERVPWPGCIEGALVVSGAVLLLATRNLRRGRIELHWLAFAQAVGGTLNLALFAVPILILLANMVAWLMLLALILLFCAILVMVMLALRTNR